MSMHAHCMNIQNSSLDAVWRLFCEGFLQDAVGCKESCPCKSLKTCVAGLLT